LDLKFHSSFFSNNSKTLSENPNAEKAQAEFMKYLKNINSEMEEAKSERDKFLSKPEKMFNLDPVKPHYQLQLFLTSEQIIKVFELLEKKDE